VGGATVLAAIAAVEDGVRSDGFADADRPGVTGGLRPAAPHKASTQ
jgi:hypothetical protein